jgi:hypothetical protein
MISSGLTEQLRIGEKLFKPNQVPQEYKVNLLCRSLIFELYVECIDFGNHL